MSLSPLQVSLKATSLTVIVSHENQCFVWVQFFRHRIGQIRRLGYGWGWRTSERDFIYEEVQDAAVAYTRWAIQKFWKSQFQNKEWK